VVSTFDYEIAYTLVKMIPGTETGCHTSLGTTYCNYITELWCTPATTPPDYAPLGVNNVPKATVIGNDAYFWKTAALCFKWSAGSPWNCVPFGVGGALLGFPAPPTYPRYPCTHNP
jgi:hypothetical protein